jgi:spermidine synthase
VQRPASRFALVLAMFFVSGMTGLLYEVAFSKLLGYVFGATAYAISTVLASFMAGLALGAHIGGRFAGRIRRPLAAYGAFEVLVGLVCALTPITFDVLTGAYVSIARANPGSLGVLTLARAGLTAMVIVVPTIAMGATLPVLSRWLTTTRDASIGTRLPVLYATNTGGGAMGALLGAYTVLPLLGIRGTMWAAAIANLVIGVIAIVAGLRGPATGDEAPASASAREHEGEADEAPHAPVEAARRPKGRELSPADARLYLGLAFLSGYLVFATEVIETHLLALLIGNSAYAFGLMLAVFLVCLSLGAARSPAFVRRYGDEALSRGLAFSALAIAITLPLWDQLPWAFAFAGKHVDSWHGRELCRAVIAFAILSIPTFFMGSTFPLLLARIADTGDVAARVGRLTVANTVGTIVGSITTGYFLLPALGSERGLVFVAAAFAAAALLASRVSGVSQKGLRLAAGLGAAATVLAVLAPKWDIARLTSGANVYFVMGPRPERIEFVREDVHGGVTTVALRNGIRTMYTNGKFQGDDGAEMTAQRHLAHFPSLFVKNDGRALVVGLGTGVTLGTITAYPYQHIDAAEISPAIVEASRLYYSKLARSSLDDPRVKLELNDGRNLLLVSKDPYDLITIELSSIWFAGSSNLYSREFYALLKSRLSPGGILQQWIQLHHIRRRELATVIRTLRSEFPHAALFIGGGQGIIVASTEPLVASRARLARLEAMPSIREVLDKPHLSDMLEELVTAGDDLDRFVRESEVEGGPMVSTDDNLYLEYATPKGNTMNYHESLARTIQLLEGYRTPGVREKFLGP